jgi:hypothetical protein
LPRCGRPCTNQSNWQLDFRATNLNTKFIQIALALRASI